MPKTLPLPEAVIDRLANRVTEVVPETEYCGLNSSALSMDSEDIEYWTANWTGRTRSKLWMNHARRYAENGVLLVVRPTTGHDVVWDVELPSAGNPAETYAWDIQDVADRILAEQRRVSESEWEGYEEPLWDPMRAEVSSMVREFYEQADADFE